MDRDSMKVLEAACQYLEAKRDGDNLRVESAGRQLEAFEHVQRLNTGYLVTSGIPEPGNGRRG
jgi:hypothetical protein